MGERTFAFVDLAGYTALTDAHGDEMAAVLVGRFADLTRQYLGADVTLVKSIGDAVMLMASDPGACLLTVRGLLHACLTQPEFPEVRAGVHTGTAVSRGGDWFGGAVNVAARVCSLAAGRQLLVTAQTVLQVDPAQHRFQDLGNVMLRGVAEPVGLFAVEMGVSATDHAIDPVCRMRCDPATAAGRLRHAQQEWWFCSLGCAARFAAHPDRYIVPASNS